ncbi:MAG TPA: gliding motility-associated C-terminal domain-containing protein [Niastella sp.]
MKRIFALFPAFLFIFSVSYSQSIQIVRFDNSLPYAAGSGVSVHFKPNLFKPGNIFSLQLSDASGNFASAVTIATVSDFFVPVINGKIPAATPPGNNYRLRILGSSGNVVSAPTNSFTITGTTAITTPAISAVNPPNIPVKCIANENMFGFLNIPNGGSSQAINFTIQSYSATDVYTVSLVNSAGTIISVLPVNAGNVGIGILSIGYYVVELVKVSGGVATVFSYIVLVERDGTGLLNLSSEHVCTGSVVKFKIENIDDNYPGSQYKISYGDGTATEVYTHDSLVANPLLSHTFITPTCNSSFATNGAFTVDLQLLNKGLNNNCTGYTTNSTKKSIVNASTPPVANFTVAPFICQTAGIKATNTSIGGFYGSGSSCLRDFISIWQYKKPSSSAYIYAPDTWISPITGHLTIPSSEVTEAGCWMLKLEVQNPQGCPTLSTKEQQVSVEVPATPNFSVNPPGICLGQSVQLTDLSNAQSPPCQNPIYSWQVTPATGFTPPVLTDPNPLVTFNSGGIYTIIQTIKNSCGIRSSAPQTVTVGGAPTVSFQSPSLNVCIPGQLNEVIDLSQPPYKPSYSTTPFAPTSYVWSVSGDPADYEFIGSNTVDYPKIKFKAFRCYDISVTVNGNCNPPNAKTIQLCFKQSPQITNSSLSQIICSGGTTAAINLGSDIPGATFNWQALYTGVTPATPVSGTSAAIAAQTYAVTGLSAGSITYTLQAVANGCTGPSKQYLVTVTPAVNAQIAYESPLCNTVISSPVTRTGTAGGTYTATAGLVIDANTGTISPSISTPGTHTVTYTINPSPPCSGVTATATVIINQGNSATAAVSYPADLCNVSNTGAISNPPVNVVQTGTTGGVYSIVPATGLPIDPVTGTITPADAKAGMYTVTYAIANTPGCADYKITTTVTIHDAAKASISYAGPICSNKTSVPVTRTGNAGGTYSAGAGLSINSATGAINAASSTPGTYTVTYTVAAAAPCPGTSATTDVTITPAPLATISYPGTLCNVVHTTATPNGPVPVSHTGSAGGAYSISPATGLALDASTGTLDPSGAKPGNYTISYTIAAFGGCSLYTTNATVTVSGTPAATIQYTSPVCGSLTAAPVTITGTQGGTFSATPTGLTIDPVTGIINAQQSTPGNYQVTYTIAPSAPCPGATAVTDVVITQAPAAAISYPATLCNVVNSSNTPNPPVPVTFSGSTGGMYSILPATGLSLNTTTGLLDPSGAVPGTYKITYTIPASGGCPVYTTSASVVVNSTPQATIQYPGSPYCNGITQPQPVSRTGSAGGVYSSTPGLSIDPATGAVTPAASSPGTYTITYTITPVAPCFSFSTTASVTITEAPVISFADPVQSICSGEKAVFKAISSLPNTNFNWSVTGVLPAGVAGTTAGSVLAPGTEIQLSFTNTGNTPQTISITVIPVNPSQNPCAGVPVVLKLTVNPIPGVPQIPDTVTYCQGTTATALTAIAAPGNHVIWYDLNMQLLPSAPVPSTTVPAQFIYYVSQANGYNCESPRKKVVVVINATPSISFDAIKDPTDCGVPSGAIIITVKDLNGTAPVPNTLLEIYYNKDLSTSLSGPFTATTNADGQLSIALAAGTYTNIRVTAKGCASNTLAGPYTLKDPTPPGKPTAGYNEHSLCSNDTLRLTALSVPGVLGNGSPNGSVPVVYVWAGPAFGNGNYTTSASTITIAPPLDQKAGFYIVYAKQGNCRSVETSFTVTVKQAPSKPMVVTRNPLCVGDELNLQASSTIPGNNPQLDYTWTGPGLNGPVHMQNIHMEHVTVKDAGLYSITVNAPVTGCYAKTDTLISIGNYPDIDMGPSPVTLPTGTQLPLTPTILNAGMDKVLPMKSFTWTPSTDITCYDIRCEKAVATVKNNICYHVKATNVYGCSDTASLCIVAFCKSAQLFIPNAFTPDGDNVNDVFMVRATGIASVKSFRIFNRYGEVVFEKYNFAPNTPAYGWDGSINGQKGVPAVYVYIAEVVCENGTEYKKHGNVTLLR